MSKTNYLEKANKALDRIQNVDFSCPTSLEVRLDALASALSQVPELSKVTDLSDCESLASIIDQLTANALLSEEVSGHLEAIESLLKQIDYDSFEDDAADELESAVTDLHDAISKLLTTVALG